MSLIDPVKQEESCMKIPVIKDKIIYEKKLSNFVNVKMNEYKNNQKKLNNLRSEYDNYLKLNIGKKEKNVDKSFFDMKYEGKRREIKSLFNKLEETYINKINELESNSSKNSTNNSMDDKIFKVESNVKDKFFQESNQVKELKEEINKKVNLLKVKKEEYDNMDYFIFNIQNKINSNLNLHRECKFNFDLKNCNSDNYNYFILLVLLNIVTVIGYHYLF
jgi:hypothetical protein